MKENKPPPIAGLPAHRQPERQVMATKQQTYILPRTGREPLSFTGRLLAQASGKTQLGQEQNRYHELDIYETAGGRFIVSIAYRTKWEGETDHLTADFFTDSADVVAELTRYDPATYLQGFPPGPHFADKQARLVRDLRARYQSLVSLVLTQAGEIFIERVD
jgi:hypothetical protein